MIVRRFAEDLHPERNAACIGYFDGVHRGHQELIKATVEEAHKRGIKAQLITFDPDPADVIGHKKGGHLNSFKRRISLFERFGIEEVTVIPFDEEMMTKSPEEFCRDVLARLNIAVLSCGEDFSFGYLGKGGVKDLKKAGINVRVVPELRYYGKKISSTRIRQALREGRYRFADRMLGYEYKK